MVKLPSTSIATAAGTETEYGFTVMLDTEAKTCTSQGKSLKKNPCNQQSNKAVEHSRKPKAFHRHTDTLYVRKKLKMHGEARPAQNRSDKEYGEIHSGKGTAACHLGKENQHVEQRTDFCKL